MFKIIIILSFLKSSANNISYDDYTPIVIWHGMGDFCCNPISTEIAKYHLGKALPKVYILSLRISYTGSVIEDFLNGYFLHPDKQIEMVCNIIKTDKLLADGYNAIGFSQGSQFLRGLLQRCPKPQMKNLVSLGAQHQGVYGVPGCFICYYFRSILSRVLYLTYIQQYFVQATYWHDPINKKAYLEENTFLADINNEILINENYIKNLQSLENFILVKFENDEMIHPRESQWFGFYKPGQDMEMQTLQESETYDRLGLKKMESEGKLHFMSRPGGHLDFKWSWFIKNIVYRFFNNKSAWD